MRIPPIQTQNIMAAYEKDRLRAMPIQSGGAMRSDEVQLSPEGVAFRDTFLAVKQNMQDMDKSPERAQRMEALAQQVNGGEYSVGNEAIARAIMRGVCMDCEA